MKLKLVVASMSVLGLISCPVLAATKHKHHKVKTIHVSHQVCKAMPELPVRPCAVTPLVDNAQIIYDSMGQNSGRIGYFPDWYNRIIFSGGINFDAHWGNLSYGYQGENNQRLSLNDAFLNTTANVNEWTKAFLSLSYNSASGDNGKKQGEYSAPYGRFLRLEQAYITFSNFNCCCWPIFVQLGKQYTDFGRYTIHPIERTMAQVLSESLQTSAKLGFIFPMGFHGQVYAFDSPIRQFDHNQTSYIYGAALGYTQLCECLGYDVGVEWMSNLIGVNDVADSVIDFQTNNGLNPFITSSTYRHSVAAVAAHADVNSGPFAFGVRYVTATQSFSPLDLSTVYLNNTFNGAKPWAADITAGYGFNAWCRNQNIYVGYQQSGNAVNIKLPQNRWILGYGIDAWKNTTLGVEFGRDRDYGTGHGGTGNSSNTIGARAAVRFG